MIDPGALLQRLLASLDEEREAIRQFDCDRVLKITEEKEALLAQLAKVSLRGRPELKAGFKDLARELRHNTILLAHARDCVRDALQAHTRGREGPRARLSVRV